MQSQPRKFLPQWAVYCVVGAIGVLFSGSLPRAAMGQQATFASGSTGSDGPMDFTARCLAEDNDVLWDATDFRSDGVTQIDPELDRVFHFETITVPSGCTVRFQADRLGNRSIVWLATGLVDLQGDLNLNGGQGHPAAAGSVRKRAVPGPGDTRAGWATPLGCPARIVKTVTVRGGALVVFLPTPESAMGATTPMGTSSCNRCWVVQARAAASLEAALAAARSSSRAPQKFGSTAARLRRSSRKVELAGSSPLLVSPAGDPGAPFA